MPGVNRRAMIALPFALAGCAQPFTPPQPTVKLPPLVERDGLVVMVTGLLYSGYSIGGVRGTAKNVSGRDFRMVSLTFDLVLADGTKVADAIASTNGLSAGQNWAFQAIVIAATSRPFSEISPPRITVI